MATNYRRYLRPPRKLLFTRDGRWFVIMTLMIGFGAVNTGNNLLYLLLGMMLGLIIVSGILSERMLKQVTVNRLAGSDIFAGREATVSYEVTNAKRLFSSYSITVTEHESRPTRESRRIALGLPAQPPRKRKAREAENEPGPPRALAIRVPAGKTVVATGRYTFPRRGYYRYVGIDLGTRFPFGFFEKLRPIYADHEVLVYPAILADYVDPLSSPAHEGEVDRAFEGRSGDFFGLREFRQGDDRRDVHWKVSARRGQLVRRLYEKQDNESVAIHLYNWIPQGMNPDDRAFEHMERLISEAATLCVRLAALGHRFSLHTLDEHVVEGSGAGQLQTALRQLAMLDIRRDAEPPAMPVSRSRQRILIGPDYVPAAISSAFATQPMAA
jgi:uncharacterized protein (DUF58 family)